jgi:hypothetical protein
MAADPRTQAHTTGGDTTGLGHTRIHQHGALIHPHPGYGQ